MIRIVDEAGDIAPETFKLCVEGLPRKPGGAFHAIFEGPRHRWTIYQLDGSPLPSLDDGEHDRADD